MTAQEIFELSMALVDEIQETGVISETDTKTYVLTNILLV
jgi:hypothetical protein